MKHIRIISLFCAVIIGGFFFGCASEPAAPPAPPPPAAAPEPKPAPQPEPEPVYPLRPIDMDIVEQVMESGDSLKRLQYYISETVTLAKETRIQNVEINKGAGLRRETSATGQIVIQKETAGVLVNTFYSSDGYRVMAVSFDAENDQDTLFFIWNEEAGCFTLCYREEYDEESSASVKSLGYGDQQFQVTFPGEELPRLLIRFNEEKTNNPYERVIRGRFIQQQ